MTQKWSSKTQIWQNQGSVAEASEFLLEHGWALDEEVVIQGQEDHNEVTKE